MLHEIDNPYTILLLIIFSAVAIAFYIVIKSKMKNPLQHQAEKRNGTLTGSPFNPHLRFYHRDMLVNVSIHMGSRYQPPETRVSVGISLVQPRNFSVYRETVASRVGKKLGSHDLQLGIDEFDSKFMIKSDDEFYMRSLLDLAVQNKLLDIHQFHPHVQLAGNNLTMKIPKIPSSDEDYDKLIDATLTIADRIIDMH